MEICKSCLFSVFLLLSSTFGEDTVAEDVRSHQLKRLVELLTSKEYGEVQCRTALTDWLLRHGEQTYYDRLSRALQHIGRTDIAIEVGQNINQDKILSLKRYVEDYHRYVQSLNIPSIQSDEKDHQHAARKRTVRDLTWNDLDLIVKRAPVPPYQKGPLHVALPLLYGILLGFGGTLLAGVFTLLVIIHISHRNQQSHHQQFQP
uniref:transmembrane and death domain protein 1 isoform X2 n=1 Tax=Monopterus albus TaxID=43700 RepID=UPI0009B46509|nr:uncharacterized protein LOC109970327 isoform X2 [Monopterus albus]